MSEIKVLIYEKSSGEIRSDCSLCGVYVFSDEESRNYHIHRANVADRVSMELTDQEFDGLQAEFDVLNNCFKCKVDINKACYHVREREKEEVKIHIYGISYKDQVPIKTLIPRK